MEDLKTCLHTFRKVDEELKQYNEKAGELRREKKELEDRMSQILSMPEYSALEKLENSEDGSILRIIRPGWKKGWSMSKKELEEGLDEYFRTNRSTNADDCFVFLSEKQEKKVSNEFAFDRTPAKQVKAKKMRV